MKKLCAMLVLCVLVVAGCSGGGSGPGTSSLPGKRVLPENNKLAVGKELQFQAIAMKTDGSQQDVTAEVEWNSSNPLVASISNAAGSKGRVTALAAGTTTITAKQGGGFFAETTLVVPPRTLDKLTISAPAATLAAGTSQQYQLTGTYSDSTTEDFSTSAVWVSSAPAVATIAADGTVVAKTAGSTTISASHSGLKAEVTLQVTSARLQTVTINPATTSMITGTSLSYEAIGRYSDGSLLPLNTTAVWRSSAPTVASVDAIGTVSASGVGTATISATQDGISGSITVTVTAAVLRSISLSPGNPVRAAGTTQQFSVTGSYSNGVTQDLTSAAFWITSDSAVASVSSTGMVTFNQPGTALITANAGSVSGNVTVTVGPADFSGIWTGTYDIFEAKETSQIGSYPFRMELTQQGNSLKGTVTLRNKASGQITGTITGNRVEFAFTYDSPFNGSNTIILMEDQGNLSVMDGVISGDSIENFSGGFNCRYLFSLRR